MRSDYRVTTKAGGAGAPHEQITNQAWSSSSRTIAHQLFQSIHIYSDLFEVGGMYYTSDLNGGMVWGR